MHNTLQVTCGTVTRPVVCLTSVSSLGYCPRSISSYAISASSSAVFACGHAVRQCCHPVRARHAVNAALRAHVHAPRRDTRGQQSAHLVAELAASGGDQRHGQLACSSARAAGKRVHAVLSLQGADGPDRKAARLHVVHLAARHGPLFGLHAAAAWGPPLQAGSECGCRCTACSSGLCHCHPRAHACRRSAAGLPCRGWPAAEECARETRDPTPLVHSQCCKAAQGASTAVDPDASVGLPAPPLQLQRAVPALLWLRGRASRLLPMPGVADAQRSVYLQLDESNIRTLRPSSTDPLACTSARTTCTETAFLPRHGVMSQ